MSFKLLKNIIISLSEYVMEAYFDSIDEYQQSTSTKSPIKDIKCCDDIENYMVCEENTTCRKCGHYR